MKTTNNKSRYLSIFLVVTVIFTMCLGMTTVSFAADQLDPADKTLVVNGGVSQGGKEVTVKAYDASYKHNVYVSIRDVAAALNGTAKEFNVVADPAYGSTAKTTVFNIVTDTAYVSVGDENQAGTGETGKASSTSTKLYIDGSQVKYYIYKLSDDANDFYIKLVDLSLALNLNIEYKNNKLYIDTSEDFEIDIDQLDSDGYFSFLHGTVLGNATTGEIIFASKENEKVAIASTTKLMTYLLLSEAIGNGDLAPDTVVTISEAVEKESKSEDGVITMTAGTQVPLYELCAAMLLPSSNEAALAIAEAVAGSEAEFVELMNEKADEIGLSDNAIFYNPHGLPNYTASAFTSKRQNSMTAKDMFKLASYIMENHSEITDITSEKTANISTLRPSNPTTNNTNPLLWNMEGEGILGLKTGTTNRSGACLVSAIEIDGEVYIAVEFGAEGSAERGEKSELLLRYAQQYHEAHK